MKTTDIWSLHPAILSSDLGAVCVRRALERLIKVEQAGDTHRPVERRGLAAQDGAVRKRKKGIEHRPHAVCGTPRKTSKACGGM
jgi:hypothetical protein